MLPFCECNSVKISQNIQNEVSLERSIFADVVAYQFINLNWKLNGSRKEDRSIWNENDQSSRPRVNREIKIHVYRKRQTSDSSWEFRRIEDKQIKTVPKDSYD